ncbi:RNA-directed DNA polymerase from mobile element jockey [Eumeta japonica]|uniref:RNA-directed DNA polymerase from mobile element jockey n=1 Tax=Eumeta variegata TaxID=151549 RepID=A0A4C1TQN9_EUMVA|nr:RNA-directed DNA polymerase from mobile element jockey [Eumeta japonica]
MAFKHNWGHRSIGVFLEALDRVCLPGLLSCDVIVNTKIPPVLMLTVASFLEGRSFLVVVKGVTSDPCPFHAEVTKGSCLSRCLCATFTDDIPSLAGQLQN